MAKTRIYVSKEFYIGFKPQSGERVPLGFATYVENNESFRKRQNTIDGWSQLYENVQITKEDPEWNPDGYQWQTKRVERPDLAAKTIPNELVEGFKLGDYIRRTGWHGGNVVWRIEDPRGFELEISSANMASILNCTTIINGVIQGKCTWGWTLGSGGNKVVLLPEVSEPYQEALASTKDRDAEIIDPATIKLGSLIRLKDGTESWYYGAAYAAMFKDLGKDAEGSKLSYGNKPIHLFTKESKYQDRPYLDVSTLTKPSIISIVSEPESELTLEEAVEYINTLKRVGARDQSVNDHVCFSATKFNKGDVTIERVDLDVDDIISMVDDKGVYWPGLTYKNFVIIHEKGDMKYSVRMYSSYDIDGNVALNTIDTLTPSEIVYKTSQGSYYSRRRYVDSHSVRFEQVKSGTLYILAAKYKNKCYIPTFY